MSGYLLCDKCRGYYSLKSNESPRDFTDKCTCGGKIRFSKSIDVIGVTNKERTFEKRQTKIQRLKNSLWPKHKITFSTISNPLNGFKNDFLMRFNKVFDKITSTFGMPVCPYCKKRLKFRDMMGGTFIKCSNCGGTMKKHYKHQKHS